MNDQLLSRITSGDIKAVARSITLIENEAGGYEKLLKELNPTGAKVIGITGPPGAGKSTLVNALIKQVTEEGKRVAILCVDPSSPFNLGALLGDRIRMGEWYTNPNVYIRSIASRGSVGGLSRMIIEITDLLKAAPFDYIILETIGVGQTEIEIAGLADVIVVVLVPEAGDQVQNMKAGLMEIADIFIVNKADREGATAFVKNLEMALHYKENIHAKPIPIIQTTATTNAGIAEVFTEIKNALLQNLRSDKKYYLLAEKAYQLIANKRMHDVNKQDIYQQLKAANTQNIYAFVEGYSAPSIPQGGS